MTTLQGSSRNYLNSIIKKADKNRRKWLTACSLDTLKKKGTAPSLLARMLFGECTPWVDAKGASENRNEMLGFWQIIKNRYGTNKSNIKTGLLSGEFTGLTGKENGLGKGRAPVDNINWRRAVLIATMLQKGKANKIRKTPGITSTMKYWHYPKQFNVFANDSYTEIRFNNQRDYYKLKAYQQHANTIFYAIGGKTGNKFTGSFG